MKKLIVLIVSVCMLLSFASCGNSAKEEDQEVKITIAAAASLENALVDEIIPAFEKEHSNIKVTGTYDASGKLQTQIEEGADVDVFFSAATKQMNALVDGDFIDKESVVDLLENKIVLVTQKKNSDSNIAKYEDIVKANTIALGDPKSVPAGQYAKESLENLGLWDDLQKKKISYGTNVTEVLNWVAEGSADVGVVYNSDALSMTDKIKVISEAPDDSVEKCIYPIGIIKKTKNEKAAKLFMEYLQSDAAVKVFEKYGFKSNL